jgi:2-keto-4-pentenoate hydratase/2-oxohepta-3-ene-1,7-dioic acid hydratase in catechol pathway
MRYLTYLYKDKLRLGTLKDEHIIELSQLIPADSMQALIDGGPELWEKAKNAVAAAEVKELAAKGHAIPYEDKLLVAPIPRPVKNIFCLGRNYDREYYKDPGEKIAARGETSGAPKFPVYFTKPPTSVIGPFDPIPLDAKLTQQLDWEAELGVVIGKWGRRIAEDNASEYIFGYTIINDLTARDLQFRHEQWFKGKGLDGSCPMGPVIVTPDELPNPVHVPISLKVNGIIKQEANTGQLIFDIPTIIADLSQTLTLEPGDIISTGTPDGVGHFRKPPEYLKVGDRLETIIEGIGTLRNQVVLDPTLA